MIEANLINILREKASVHHQREISSEWAHFTARIREFLLEEAGRGKTRTHFPLNHPENTTRAKEYLESFGFRVGTYANNSGRGITIEY